MRKLPTDLQILDAIYEMYFDEYASFTDDGPSKRLSKVYVPLDIEKVAAKLATEGDIVFGRLYYVMDRKYAYKDDSDGSLVPFFAAHSLSPEFHCIHFPYMASVLAQLRQEHRTARQNFFAAAVSAIAAVVSVFAALWPSPAPQQVAPVLPAAAAPVLGPQFLRDVSAPAPQPSRP